MVSKIRKSLRDNVIAGVLIVFFIVLTITSTITMQRSFDSAQRSDTKALISYVRCLVIIPRDTPDRVGSLNACAEAAIKRGK